MITDTKTIVVPLLPTFWTHDVFMATAILALLLEHGYVYNFANDESDVANYSFAVSPHTSRTETSTNIFRPVVSQDFLSTKSATEVAWERFGKDICLQNKQRSAFVLKNFLMPFITTKRSESNEGGPALADWMNLFSPRQHETKRTDQIFADGVTFLRLLLIRYVSASKQILAKQ